jgi:hypothetical protein
MLSGADSTNSEASTPGCSTLKNRRKRARFYKLHFL